MSWKDDLRELLDGYWSDQAIDEGAEELAHLTRANPEYHEQYLAAIEEGIQSASRGEGDAAEIMVSCGILRGSTPVGAREYLEALRSSYLLHHQG